MAVRQLLDDAERKKLIASVAAQLYPVAYSRFRGLDRTPLGAHHAAIKDAVDAAEALVEEVFSRE